MQEQAKPSPQNVTPVFNQPAPVTHREIEVKTYSIHDILDGKDSCPVTVADLQHLIRCQADLHMAKVHDDQVRLKELLTDRKNTLRGFVLYGENVGPLAYLVYYPMIDSKGSRVAYCEDFYIAESFRGHGTAKILFHELAKHTIADNFEYIQWATDRRNEPVHNFVQKKLGAKLPGIITLSANSLLEDPASLVSQWSGKEYETRELEANDVNMPVKLGLSPNIIRNTGDLPFKGFVTVEKSKPTVPVALTPGWIHLSTFQLKEGLHLEQPVFLPHNNKEGIVVDQEGIARSVIEAARTFADSNELKYFRWHINEADSPMKRFLQDTLGLQRDSMLKGRPETELVVYTLSNGALQKLNDIEPDRVLHIPLTAPIGVRKTGSDPVITPPSPANDP